METDDLFHLDRAMTPAERRQLNVKLRSKKRGHIAPPGTGPESETCGSCEHLYRNVMSKTYLKCSLNRAKWTGGGGTDVRSKDPACREWAMKVRNGDHQ